MRGTRERKYENCRKVSHGKIKVGHEKISDHSIRRSSVYLIILSSMTDYEGGVY